MAILAAERVGLDPLRGEAEALSEDPGRVVPIAKPRVVMGRAECDLVLSDPQLSRQHALIAINGTSARLEDLGSTNGTFVDEKRIQTAELVDRSEFRIGSHELVFVMRDEEDV